MAKYDARCKECDHEFEEFRKWSEPCSPCPQCKSNNTVTIWKTVPILDKACDPYDKLDRVIPDSKPIKSYANDRRRGGKDTT